MKKYKLICKLNCDEMRLLSNNVHCISFFCSNNRIVQYNKKYKCFFYYERTYTKKSNKKVNKYYNKIY